MFMKIVECFYLRVILKKCHKSNLHVSKNEVNINTEWRQKKQLLFPLSIGEWMTVLDQIIPIQNNKNSSYFTFHIFLELFSFKDEENILPSYMRKNNSKKIKLGNNFQWLSQEDSCLNYFWLCI